MLRPKKLEKQENDLQNMLIFSKWHLIWHLIWHLLLNYTTKKEPKTLLIQCFGTL